ncbi:DUF4926 domain-containing protein [Candidatus Poribacteria bacterium]|nr:DUF4926 domain-containing protein [Candidatus Poribacteria bacterium]
MKNKSSDNTSNIDNLSEHNRELRKKGKIKLLDVVALTQDVPQHNLKRGDIGTVVEILSNGEAYEVEFSNAYGQMSKCLSFLVSQLRVLPHEQIKADAKLQKDKQVKGVTEKGKNAAAQRLIKAMEKPPHLTDEDIEALNRSIKEGEIPIKFDSIFEPGERDEE